MAERGHQRAGNAASFVMLAAAGARRPRPAVSGQFRMLAIRHERKVFWL